MSPLPDSLQAFAARVWDPAAPDDDPGYAVYRRNLHGNFAAVLALEFPAVQRLLGDAAFRALSRDFQRAHPSTCGDLHGIGAPFAAWLRQQPEFVALPWLGDVAALEWAWEQAAVAADAVTEVDVAAFVALDPDRQLALRARLHPALGLLRSPYPVFTIWRDNLPDAAGQVAALAGSYSLSLDRGGETVLVERPGQAVEVTLLQPGEAAWLEALAAGATLGGAIEQAAAVGPEFDLGAVLAAALQRDRIIALH